MPYYVYILANEHNGTIYIGSTSNIIKRIWQHKNKLLQGFISKYHVDKLVYFEEYQDIRDMAYREKHLKEWKRSWKIRLIEQNNPKWKDLFHILPDPVLNMHIIFYKANLKFCAAAKSFSSFISRFFLRLNKF
jgi:Predicted endonuclease containing a URI domain